MKHNIVIELITIIRHCFFKGDYIKNRLIINKNVVLLNILE